ncbi:MAG: WG repeat-containing protein, partial [Candidatus Melainabacteria bacterium]|nr:WG repeat-containing protein [Candidatus Melainabacteria bacterium]
MPDIWSLIAVGLTALFLTSSSGHKFGYVDKHGREVISAKYWQAWPFQNGFARCYGTDSKTGKDDWTTVIFLDKGGREYKSHLQPEVGDVSKPHTFLIEGKEIREDRSPTEVIEKNGIKFVRGPYSVNIVVPNGKKTIDANSLGWKGINPSTGNQWFLKDGQASEFTGAVGKSSVPGIEPVAMPQLIDQYVGVKTAMNEKYDCFGEASEGLIAARSRSNRWYYLRPDSSVAIELPANVCSTQPFSEGLAAVAVGGVTWIDTGGHSSINPLKNATFGFIDKTGKFVIPPKFPCPATDWHSKFKDGLAIATAEKNGTTALGYINTKGDFVVPPKYLRLDEFSEGLAAFDANPVGFDPEEWQKRQRRDVRQFLRQYNIFSMTKTEVKNLLGEPNDHTK